MRIEAAHGFGLDWWECCWGTLIAVFLKGFEHGRAIQDVFFHFVVCSDEFRHQGEDFVQQICWEDDDAFERVAEDDVALWDGR
jgi:hypothetical protein